MASEKSVLAVIRASRPTFRNLNDKIAFAVHSSFLVSGYVLTATGPHALSDTALSNPSTDEASVDHWNELNDEYAFVYAYPEKGSKKVLVKCLVMNGKLLVHALPEGSSEPLHLEINVGDYAGEDGGSNYSKHYNNLEKLVKKIDEEILSKLEGSSGASSSTKSSETSNRTTQEIYEPGFGFGEPTGPPVPPSGVILPPVGIGSGSDLLPGPAAGVYPSRDGRGIDGSMLLGPNDPRWFGGVGGEHAFPGGLPKSILQCSNASWVNPETVSLYKYRGKAAYIRPPSTSMKWGLHTGGVPPGARFDPYGPPGVPGFEPNRFARNPRRPGFDNTHPDLEPFRRNTDSDFI